MLHRSGRPALRLQPHPRSIDICEFDAARKYLQVISTALAAPVTLPLLPVSAYATPGNPAIAAYRKWLAANEAYERSFDPPNVPDDDPIMNATGDAALAANLALCDTIATTPEGLAGQAHLALYTFGDLECGEDWLSPDNYEVGGFGYNQGRRLLMSMLTGAKGMAA